MLDTNVVSVDNAVNAGPHEDADADVETQRAKSRAGLPAGWIIKKGQPRPEYITAEDACTEVANAQRIAHLLRDKVCYVDKIGWHVFDPPWRFDPHAARALVQMLGRKIARDEAAQMAAWVAAPRDANEAARRRHAMDARFKWATKSEALKTIEASMSLAQDLMNVEPETLDSNINVLGCKNGVLDLADFTFHPYTPADTITKTTACDYAPDACCPAWSKFVSEVMGGDADAVSWLQRFLGSCLPGSHPDQIILMCVGGGSNGKTTLFEAIEAALGGYADAAAPGLLVTSKEARHPTEVADLRGKRLVVTSETGERNTLAEDKVKQMTGSDTLKARFMRQDFFHFKPTHQLVLLTNHRPTVRGTDEGIWRRIRVLPFAQQFTGERRDKALPARLEAERAGILNWMLDGLREYRRIGLDDLPPIMADANQEYRRSSDVIGAFIDQCCSLDQSFSTQSRELYGEYQTWCKENGEWSDNARKFATGLREHGLRSEHSATGTVWRGVSSNGSRPSDDQPY